MVGIPGRVVIDASVGLQYVLQEAGWEDARRVLEAAAFGEVQLVAPYAWQLECANACWRRARRKLMTDGAAVLAVETLRSFDLSYVDAEILIDHAVDIAFRCRTSTYDAMYAAAAEYVDGVLVTADGALLSSLEQNSWSGQAVHVSKWRLN